VNPGAGDKPLSVRSDELEAVEEGGARRMVFQRNVRVEQGDLVVNSERLEAHYPPNTNQPDKLYATGHVRIVQKDRVLTCDNATYYQADERLVCVGNSELTRGNDRVRGDQIEIYTSQNRVLVHGRAVVNVTPDAKETKPEPKKAEATP
jgi:lipopolysaccharide transport protein LptA